MNKKNLFLSLLIAIGFGFTFSSCDPEEEFDTITSSSLPRSMASANGKVYVVLFDGHVAQLDTTSLTVKGEPIAIGPNPEGSVIVNNKLYVSNSGGLQTTKDSTVSVIDLVTFKEIKKIKVNLNPGAIKADSYGDVYVVSNGNYTTIPGKFQRIEAGTDKVTDIAVSVKNFEIVGDNAYISNFEYDDSWQAANKTISIYDVKNEKVISSNIVNTEIIKTPYSIGVNPVSKDIYLGVSDYVNKGKVYCFKEDGTFKFEFTSGLNPCKFVFSKDNSNVFVLNQGKFQANNAGMSLYNLTNSTLTEDYFQTKNMRGLGDTGQDMIRYGSKIYVAVYNSSIIEVIDAKTGVSIKTIPMVTKTKVSKTTK